MDNVIRQVIESEYRAQKILQEAEEERKNSNRNVEQELLEVKGRIFNEARLEIERLKAEKKLEAQNEAEKIIAGTQTKISEMRKIFEKNREQWVKSLFDKITGR